MNENHPPEVHEFYRGSSNQIAIRAYLDIKDDGEIARLAAMMTKPKTFDPAALVDDAISLQDETKASLVRRREAMVETMNYSTLLSLLQKLRDSHSLYVDDDDENLQNPVVGPVLRRLRSTVSEGLQKSHALDKVLIADELANADSRTHIPRPALPCDLEDALRYAANAPDCPWSVLERAFKDFLGINRSKIEAEENKKGRTSIREKLDRDTKMLANLKPKATSDPQLLSSQHKLEEEIKMNRQKVDEWKKQQFYRDYFMPDSETPANIAEESARFFEKYWQAPGSVFQEPSLVFFATDFHAFWQTHGEAYLRLYETAEKQLKLAANRNRKAGAKGAATREHKKWLGHTTAFISFLNKGRNWMTPAVIQQSVTTFAEQHSNLRDKDAKTKLKSFLGTLCNPAAHNGDASTVRSILQNCGIKTCGEDTICECLNLLNAALNPIRKKSEKLSLTDSDPTVIGLSASPDPF